MAELLDISTLPSSIQERLKELDDELEEGDITHKGYDKKRKQLLDPYTGDVAAGGGVEGKDSPRTQSPTIQSLNLMIDDGETMGEEFSISVRKDAVHAAMQTRRTNGPISSKRSNPSNRPTETSENIGDSDVLSSKFKHVPTKSPKPRFVQPSVRLPRTGSNDSLDRLDPGDGELGETDLAIGQPKQVNFGVDLLRTSQATKIGSGGVSDKIQALLTTLSRPNKDHPESNFIDYDDDLLPDYDPSAPKPVGTPMQPAVGPAPELSGQAPSLDEQLTKHAQALKKATSVTCLDVHGKPSLSLTYEKLFQKVCRVGFTLLHKTSGLNEGDRVALVFSTGEPINVAAAFYGCLSVNILPLMVDPPLSRDAPGGSQVGFLLGGLGVSYALTSESTFRNLPRDESGHLHIFKGWPKLQWITIENTNRPTRDFKFPSKLDIESPAYIESTTDRDGAALGVSISHHAILTHTRTLVHSCEYKQGEVVVCTEDVKRSVGLWHGLLACLYAGVHVIFIPPVLLNSTPLIWLHMVHRFDASCVILSSRVMNTAIAQSQASELRYMTLAKVRMFLVRDAQNPWSLGSCDAFVDAFKAKGIKQENLVLCASSPETMTLSIRRAQQGSSARGVMSIHGLSYGIVRVEEEGSYTSLTLQDVGHVVPGARVAVVKISGQNNLCKTDEIGELCVSSLTCGSEYWGLKGKSGNIFQIRLMDPVQNPIGTGTYVRSGLLGFIGAGGLVFVCGSMDGLIISGGRRHNREDITATVLAVDPPRFVFKNRVAVFSVPVLKDERVIAIAEVRDDAEEDIAFKWMNTVVSAVETIHGISLYGVMLVASNSLPKIRGSVYIPETRTKYLDGSLKLEHLLMCPHQCITNIPVLTKPSDRTGPGIAIGELMRGGNCTQLQGPPVTPNKEIGNKFRSMGEILEWRATKYGDIPLFSTSDLKGKVSLGFTGGQLLKKSERVGAFLADKGKLNSGQIIALLLPPGLDLIAGFYGSLLIGLIPVVIRNVTPQNYPSLVPTIKHILERSKASAILTSHSTIRQLKSKEVAPYFDLKVWPLLLDIDDTGRRKLDKIYHPPTSEMIAYIDYTVSSTGVLTGTKISHQNCLHFCRAHQQTCELNPNHTSVLILEPSSGVGLMIYLLSSVFSGQQTILIQPSEFVQNPLIWFTVLSQQKAFDTYCSYSVIETCLRELSNATQNMKSKGISLTSLQSLVVVAEERPRVNMLSPFSVFFAPLGLNPRAISTSFGCRVNSAICIQGLKQPAPMQVYLDSRALKLDKIKVVERGIGHSILLSSTGRLLPGVTVIVVNSITRIQLGEGELGEVWVHSDHNSIGFDGIGVDISAKIHKEHFQAQIHCNEVNGQQFARTGFLGFLMKGEEEEEGTVVYHLFIVGSIEGSLNLDSARYYPGDLENSVNRSHKFISSSAVFEGDHLLVVVAELESEDKDPLCVVPRITTALVEEHHVIPGVVVVVDPRTIPINSRGEIQRLHLKDSFLSDQLDPIYIAYNL